MLLLCGLCIYRPSKSKKRRHEETSGKPEVFLYGRCNLAVKGESFGYALLIQGMNASVAQKPAQITAHVAYVIVMAIVNIEYASTP